ncbi:zinc finger, CCHC-type containing protein, partial [Tanacetum coccineum]
KGLRHLNRADPFVEISVSARGEHVLAAAGEIHLERCIKDIKEETKAIAAEIEVVDGPNDKVMLLMVSITKQLRLLHFQGIFTLTKISNFNQAFKVLANVCTVTAIGFVTDLDEDCLSFHSSRSSINTICLGGDMENGPCGSDMENGSCGQNMAQPDNNNTLSSAFKTFFEREKLTGDNFNDWYRSLRIVLRVAGTYDYLYKPCPDEPPENAAENVKVAWKAEYKIHSDVACLMLGKMSPALQRQFELYFPQAMLNELRKMFEKPPAVEIYDLVDTLHSCKQAPGKSVSAHVLEMKGYMDQLQALGKPYDNDMAINLINRSLNKDFGDFVRNFNMHCVGKTVSDLHALLIDFEKGLKDKAPTPQVLAIQKGRVNKPKPQANKKGKGKGKADKNKQVVAYQPNTSKNPLGTGKSKDGSSYQEGEHGAVASGFRVKRKLSYGEQYLHVGNGAQAAVEAI